MILELKNLQKEYKINREQKFKALRGISLTFQGGELISIIGESGSGKSTLMNLLGGLDNDYQGEILLDGHNIHQYKEKELDKYRKNNIGFVFQSFNLIPHLTILDNITIAMTLSNIGKEERTKRAKEILQEVGLMDQIYKKPNQLSGGQKQRVAIARALINNPDIILADEPTGSLDSETSSQILEIIKKIAAKGKLVIMVTHSDKVAASSTRIVRIADGLIINDQKTSQKTPQETSHTPAIKEKQNLSFLAAIALALKNMKEKIGRNILVSLGASIGITSVIIMLSIGNGVGKYMTDTMNQYVNPLVVEVSQKADPIPGETQNPGTIMIGTSKPFQEEDIQKLQGIKNVTQLEKAYTSTSFNEYSLNLGEENQRFQNLATLSKNITPENITKGTAPKEGEILISAALEDKFQESLLGKTITLKVTLDGQELQKDYLVSGLFGEISATGMENFHYVFLSYQDLENLAAGKVDIKANTIYLSTDQEKNIQAIKDKVADLGYQGSKEEQLLGMFTEMLDVVTYILAAVAAISLVVSAIMILVVLYISVVERTREIGVLKAIGARRKDIKRIFVAESFLIGLGSGLIGLGSAIILMLIINSLTNRLYEVDLVLISGGYALFGLMISIGISIIAGLFPASKAAKLDPVESLRRE